MASPRAKYSQSARTVIAAVAMATTQVGVNNTRPTTTGINTSAVATRFQVMNRNSSRNLPRPRGRRNQQPDFIIAVDVQIAQRVGGREDRSIQKESVSGRRIWGCRCRRSGVRASGSRGGLGGGGRG